MAINQGEAGSTRTVYSRPAGAHIALMEVVEEA